MPSTTSNTSSQTPSVNGRQPNNPTKQHLPFTGNFSTLLPPCCQQPLPPLAARCLLLVPQSWCWPLPLDVWSVIWFWSVRHPMSKKKKKGGPEGRPNNLQSAWRLTELFFQSNLSWSQTDLCAYSFVISTHFSLLSSLPSCTRYISNVGIKTGLNSFRNFPYITTFSLRSISVFYLWKTEWFWEELSSSETVIFGPCNFGKRSFSEILDQCNFRKNGVWRNFLNSLLSHLLSKNTWTSAILGKNGALQHFSENLLLHLLNTNTFLANPDQNNFGKNWFQIQFLCLKVLTRLSNSLYILFLQSNIYFH